MMFSCIKTTGRKRCCAYHCERFGDRFQLQTSFGKAQHVIMLCCSYLFYKALSHPDLKHEERQIRGFTFPIISSNRKCLTGRNFRNQPWNVVASTLTKSFSGLTVETFESGRWEELWLCQDWHHWRTHLSSWNRVPESRLGSGRGWLSSCILYATPPTWPKEQLI